VVLKNSRFYVKNEEKFDEISVVAQKYLIFGQNLENLQKSQK